MSYKWLGMLIVIAGCGGAGFRMAMHCRQEERDLRDLIEALDFMKRELEYRMPALPELCRLASELVHGSVGTVLHRLYQEMEAQAAPDAGCCMAVVLAGTKDLSPQLETLFQHMGAGLGRFDFEGQLEGLNCVRREARDKLDRLQAGQTERIRSYQTLGLCAGAALAILFL